MQTAVPMRYLCQEKRAVSTAIGIDSSKHVCKMSVKDMPDTLQNYDRQVKRFFKRVLFNAEEEIQDTMDFRVGWDASGPNGHGGKMDVSEVAEYFFREGLALGIELSNEKSNKSHHRRS